MSYGAKSNDDLVMYYGFVEPDNPADAFKFGDMLAWLQQRRGSVVNDDRLQTLYSKGLQDAVRCVLLCAGVLCTTDCPFVEAVVWTNKGGKESNARMT